jgi:hypothetical protein
LAEFLVLYFFKKSRELRGEYMYHKVVQLGFGDVSQAAEALSPFKNPHSLMYAKMSLLIQT